MRHFAAALGMALALSVTALAQSPKQAAPLNMAAIRAQFATKDAEIAALKQQNAQLRAANSPASPMAGPPDHLAQQVQQYDDLIVAMLSTNDEYWYNLGLASNDLSKVKKLEDATYADGNQEAVSYLTTTASAEIAKAQQAQADVTSMVTEIMNIYHGILADPQFSKYYKVTHLYFPSGYKAVGILTNDASVDDLCQLIRK